MKPPIEVALDIARDWAASLPEPLTHDQYQRLNDLQMWITNAIAAAVQAEREAILAEADSLEFKPSKWSDLLAAIRARNGATK